MTEIAERILQCSKELFYDAVMSELACVEKSTESPIEAMLGVAILIHDKLAPSNPFDHLILCGQGEEEAFYGQESRLLIPQYIWKSHRIDWVLREPVFNKEPLVVFIECDGHNFHERTKEQAARDRLRDRVIQEAGYCILRFTGSEIYRNAMDCSKQVFRFVENKLLEKYEVPVQYRSNDGVIQ